MENIAFYMAVADWGLEVFDLEHYAESLLYFNSHSEGLFFKALSLKKLLPLPAKTPVMAEPLH